MQALLLALSFSLYHRLLSAYPEEFRLTFGREMEQVFRDGCRDAMRKQGVAGLAAYWIHILGDLLLSACKERLATVDKRALALLLLALMVGIWIGLVDYRSNEVQNAVLLLAVSTFLFGLCLPGGAWRWAIAIGLGVPIVHYAGLWLGLKPPYPVQPGVYASFLALIPAFIGTYAGVIARFLFAAISEA